MKGDLDTRLAMGIVFVALLSVVFGLGYAPQTLPSPGVSLDKPQRMDPMKSGGPDASRTITPAYVALTPFERVAEVAGLFLKQRELKNIELGRIAFDPRMQCGCPL